MSPTKLNGIRRREDALQILAPEQEIDVAARRALERLGGKKRYADAVDAARELVQDNGLTIDIERLRDRTERRFGGIRRLVLSQPGVLHRLLLEAIEPEDLQRDERQRARRRREERDQENRLEEAQTELQRMVVHLMEGNQRLLEQGRETLDQNAELLRHLVESRSDPSEAPSKRRGPATETATGTKPTARKARAASSSRTTKES